MLGYVVNDHRLRQEVVGNRLEVAPAQISETVTQTADAAVVGDQGGMAGLI